MKVFLVEVRELDSYSLFRRQFQPGRRGTFQTSAGSASEARFLTSRAVESVWPKSGPKFFKVSDAPKGVAR